MRNQPLLSGFGQLYELSGAEISIIFLRAGLSSSSEAGIHGRFRCSVELSERPGASAGREKKRPRRPRAVSAIY